MTTPERLRRRQRIEGVVLILLGVLMVLQSWHVQSNANDQRECLQGNFTALSEALDARGGLAAREGAATEAVIRAVSAADGDEAALDEAFDAYEREQTAIDKVRADNPLPPFPPGTCEREG